MALVTDGRAAPDAPGELGWRRRAPGRLGFLPFALVALLSGCEPPGPDGIDHVLFFVHAGSPYVGQTQSITIPRSVHVGGNSNGRVLYRSRTYHYDFDGTTIEVSVPVGAVLLAADLGADGYTLTVRCDAEAGPALWVNILANGAVRYRDGTYLECYPSP